MKRILVLIGTPGVGKSSISESLATRLGGVHISLSDLVRNEGLSCGFDTKRETLIADEEKVSKRLKEISKKVEGYVIIDGHFAMDVITAVDVFLAFVLRRNPDELQEVLRERGFSEGKISENVAAEILDVCLFDAVKAYGEQKVCEVNVSNRSIDEITEEIACVVNGGMKCRIGIVDWLTKLESEGRLDSFLASF